MNGGIFHGRYLSASFYRHKIKKFSGVCLKECLNARDVSAVAEVLVTIVLHFVFKCCFFSPSLLVRQSQCCLLCYVCSARRSSNTTS